MGFLAVLKKPLCCVTSEHTQPHLWGCPRWLCLCPMWVLGTYSLTPETAHSPQDTLRTQCSQYPYMLHTCRSVANARVSTFTLGMDRLQSMHTHTCAHTQTHTTYTLESRLYRHCRHCRIKTMLYPTANLDCRGIAKHLVLAIHYDHGLQKEGG